MFGKPWSSRRLRSVTVLAVDEAIDHPFGAFKRVEIEVEDGIQSFPMPTDVGEGFVPFCIRQRLTGDQMTDTFGPFYYIVWFWKPGGIVNG
jgi:hypothetical protein